MPAQNAVMRSGVQLANSFRSTFTSTLIFNTPSGTCENAVEIAGSRGASFGGAVVSFGPSLAGVVSAAAASSTWTCSALIVGTELDRGLGGQ